MEGCGWSWKRWATRLHRRLVDCATFCEQWIRSKGNWMKLMWIIPAPRIIVREKRDLQSQQFEERLSTGAVVEQTELVGDRLHYWRLSGSGPESGWVSLRMAQKDLLVLVKPPLRHWRSELTPVLRSSSAHSERPRPAMSLPRLPQPKSAPPPARMRQDHSLPPLPLNQDRAMYSMQSLQSVT